MLPLKSTHFTIRREIQNLKFFRQHWFLPEGKKTGFKLLFHSHSSTRRDHDFTEISTFFPSNQSFCLRFDFTKFFECDSIAFYSTFLQCALYCVSTNVTVKKVRDLFSLFRTSLKLRNLPSRYFHQNCLETTFFTC